MSNNISRSPRISCVTVDKFIKKQFAPSNNPVNVACRGRRTLQVVLPRSMIVQDVTAVAVREMLIQSASLVQIMLGI